MIALPALMQTCKFSNKVLPDTMTPFLRVAKTRFSPCLHKQCSLFMRARKCEAFPPEAFSNHEKDQQNSLGSQLKQVNATQGKSHM